MEDFRYMTDFIIEQPSHILEKWFTPVNVESFDNLTNEQWEQELSYIASQWQTIPIKLREIIVKIIKIERDI